MNLHSNTGISSFGKELYQVTQKKRTIRYKKSQALKDLERLSLDAKRIRYPLNPYPVGEKYRDDIASGLTKAIIAFIRLKRGQAERISTTGRPINNTKTFIDTLPLKTNWIH